MKQTEQTNQKKPKMKVRAGQIVATVWTNQIKKGTETFEYETVKIEKTYKDKEEWKTTNSFKLDELPKVQLVLTQILQKLQIKEQ